MIKILVDSTADCAKSSFVDAVIPVEIFIDGKNYIDGIDIDADTFYQLLVKSSEFPKTSQPSPERFMTVFSAAKEAGDEVLCLILSSALSGTFQSACIAKETVGYDGIYIIDTKTTSHGISLLASHAAKRVKEGASLSEIATECEALKARIRIFAGLDTLEYLCRGGRLSKTAATIGELARIKPAITITEEGTVSMIAKSLGKVGAMQQLIKQIKNNPPDPAFPMSMLYTYGEENCIQLENMLAEKGYQISGHLQVGAGIGAHTGPGVFGVLYIAE